MLQVTCCSTRGCRAGSPSRPPRTAAPNFDFAPPSQQKALPGRGGRGRVPGRDPRGRDRRPVLGLPGVQRAGDPAGREDADTMPAPPRATTRWTRAWAGVERTVSALDAAGLQHTGTYATSRTPGSP
ncbi:hypothetical protein QJS66_21995 [Kocuria rhizophila]|nr:hypothetical protein QJS66_21995 [Kocuria rhizophila]